MAHHDTASARVLLALACGGLLAAAGATFAPADPATTIAPAVVTRSASCPDGGRDTVRIDTRSGTVTTAVDACGEPLGQRVEVLLADDGSVAEVVSLAGTHTTEEQGDLRVVVLGLGALATVGGAVLSLHASRRRGIGSAQ